MTTTVTHTIKSSGGDYSTLTSWEAAQQADLVALDQIKQAECYDFSQSQADPFSMFGWTTDPYHYVRIYTPVSQRHDGRSRDVSGKGFQFTHTGGVDNATAFSIGCSHVRFEGLCIKNTRDGAYSTIFRFWAGNFDPGSDIRIEKCIGFNTGAAATPDTPMVYVEDPDVVPTILNSLFYGSALVGVGIDTAYCAAGEITNCTFNFPYNHFGIAPGSRVVVRNCYSGTTDISNSFYISSGYIHGSNNVSADGTAASLFPGANSQINVSPADVFADASIGNSADYRLKYGSVLEGRGTYVVATDLVGNVRDTSTPDIGAVERSPIVRTIGTGGGFNVTLDYSSIAAWEATLGSSHFDQTGRLLWASSANEMIISAAVDFAGSIPSHCKVVLEAGDADGNAGGGIRNHFTKLKNALRYDASLGAGIRLNAANGNPPLRVLGMPNVTLRYLQIGKDNTGSGIIDFESAGGVIDSCLLEAMQAPSWSFYTSGFQSIIKDSLILITAAPTSSKYGIWNDGLSKFINCTVVLTVPTVGSIGILRDLGPTILRNVSLIGFETDWSGSSSGCSVSSCVTDKSSGGSALPGSSHQYDAAGVSEFVSIVADEEDLRLKSTAKSRDKGGFPGAPTTDIAGTLKGYAPPAIISTTPTLDLVLTSSLDPRVTHARASVGTYFDSNGILQTATSNVPRFDYDPITRVARGLLCEEQRINLLLRSDDLTHAVWPTNATLTANQTTAPDGTTAAEKFADTAINDRHYVYQSYLTTIGSTYTASIFAKAGTRRYVQVQHGGSSADNAYAIIVDLYTGSVTDTRTNGSPGGSYTVTYVGLGWFRITVTITTGYNPTYFVVCTSDSATPTYDANSNPLYTGDGSYLYPWGAQAELGTFATSYIPTAGSTVTRLRDLTYMDGVNFTSWYRQGVGSFVVEGSRFADYSTQVALSVGNGGDATERVAWMYSRENGTGGADWYWQTAGVAQADLLGASSLDFKMACAYQDNDFVGVLNGVVEASDSAGTVSTSVGTLTVGNSVGETQSLNGWLKRVRYWNRRLTNIDQIALTAQ